MGKKTDDERPTTIDDRRRTNFYRDDLVVHRLWSFVYGPWSIVNRHALGLEDCFI